MIQPTVTIEAPFLHPERFLRVGAVYDLKILNIRNSGKPEYLIVDVEDRYGNREMMNSECFKFGFFIGDCYRVKVDSIKDRMIQLIPVKFLGKKPIEIG